MNKSALKSFAINARRELLKKVEMKAMELGITESSIKNAEIESSDAIFITGRQLTHDEKQKRDKLIERIYQIGFKQVVEEVAYTWFNRFTALRFMEVNDYLPTRVRVLSSSDPHDTEPEMLKEALSLNLDIDKEYVYELKMENKTEELFKYLIIKHCNDLNRYMPFMFEKIEDYTEILFPDGLLAPDSFVRHMTNREIIAEDNWRNVEIIGWLYQYYIAEENDRVIRAKKRYKKEEIPFATQLFTPEWIVKYMVQNSLGRYWIENNPDHEDLAENWEFYLNNEENEQNTTSINLSIEQVKCFDPAAGSGHILVYMFDLLYEIYEKSGYMEREIPRLIIENNLYGLDIDERAYQLACFSLVMKGLEYDRRFLRNIEKNGLNLNIASIQETNEMTDEDIAFLAGEEAGENYEKMKQFIRQFQDAKAIGSLIKVEHFDEPFLHKRLETLEKESGGLFNIERKERLLPLFKRLMKQAKMMNDKYDIVVSNPPYAGRKYLTKEIAAYIDKHYKNGRSDLFSSFIEYSFHVTKENGQMGFMTPYVWMFISSYEKLRGKIIQEKNISSLVQLEYSGFDGATVPICTFTLRNYKSDKKGEYVRLTDFPGAKNQPIKTMEAVKNPNVTYRYCINQENLMKIPGSPIAFWISETAIDNFLQKKFSDYAKARAGMITGNNATFTKLWYEVSFEDVGLNHFSRESAKDSGKKWFPYNKGGGFCKWYGNHEFVVDWENDGYNLQNTKDASGKVPAHAFNFDYIFKRAITWSSITSAKFSARHCEGGFLFDAAGSFAKTDDNHLYMLGFLNSKVAEYYLSMLNPTLNFQKGNIESLPILERKADVEKIEKLVEENIAIAKDDWDSYEISWDFAKHPFLKFPSIKIEDSYNEWDQITEKRFLQLKKNEEELNRIFIQIYELEKELVPQVSDEDVSVRKSDLTRDVKSFISYSVGCMFGRYSLDEDGLIYAGGKFESAKYKTFPVDEDNILPILPGAFFEDDIVDRFLHFVKVTYGDETLEENLNFVADALCRRKNETARETLRRYFLNDFYKDHVQMYSKRPIFWLFTSGREKAFNCLIYMHRYDKTTLSRIRTDYLHDVQTRYETMRQDLMHTIEGEGSASEIRNAKKELVAIDKKIEELKLYDEKLHHMADMQIELDFDDGVKVNYEKLKGLVAKI